ncbi:succinate dehydrogenase/fumarate reductase cytochrome b subunit [Helicobacter valdiviensis]|uniref:Fumarate reductase cytochrome b subunit n=1 Tax=Helicobacter valdiviensis TaxID=1458358 RepID=A0A2W6MVA8_9HELI|nr:fumarate reductase cytochrome b subunit [Helicobacter valdiviensis]PZT48445.1 succinate dehydrogenase/fumarate reductase cytochrome b subunit [Helicobacter valdiviensis]
MQNDEVVIQSYLKVTSERKKRRNPARWDKWQSITGVVLAIFILFHMCFTSSILFGEDAFNAVVAFSEGSFIFGGHGIPWITTIVVAVIGIFFVAHAFLAMRKFPANFQQLMIFKTHKNLMKHCDTTLWWVQFITGFILFFMGSAHLFTILFASTNINAITSATRFVQGNLAEFYLFLLVVMVLHASVGLYRVIIKWVPLEAPTTAQSNIKRRNVKIAVFTIFIVLGVIAFIADFTWIALGKSL